MQEISMVNSFCDTYYMIKIRQDLYYSKEQSMRKITGYARYVNTRFGIKT